MKFTGAKSRITKFYKKLNEYEMRIYSWNVNGIRSAAKKGFQDWFAKCRGDIICLQETRALEDQVEPEIYSPEGFHSYWNPAEKKGYSGVAVFSKKEPLDVKTGFGVEEFDSEGRILQLEYEDFVLFNIYFPNGSASDERLEYKMRFYDTFFKASKALVKKGKNVIACGDYNTCHKEIDIARPKANETRSGFLPMEREWMDKYVESGFVDTFRIFNQEADQYSWWSQRGGARQRNVGWRIDYFFVNESFKEKVKDGFIHQETMGSDHCPIGIDLK